MAHRPQKLAALIRDEAAMLMLQIPQGPYGIITISEVEVTPDLAYATIYVGTLKEPEKAIKVLRDRSKELKAALSKKLTTYKIPILRFAIDDRGSRGEHIEKLLAQSLKENTPEDTQGKGR